MEHPTTEIERKHFGIGRLPQIGLGRILLGCSLALVAALLVFSTLVKSDWVVGLLQNFATEIGGLIVGYIVLDQVWARKQRKEVERRLQPITEQVDRVVLGKLMPLGVYVRMGIWLSQHAKGEQLEKLHQLLTNARLCAGNAQTEITSFCMPMFEALPEALSEKYVALVAVLEELEAQLGSLAFVTINTPIPRLKETRLQALDKTSKLLAQFEEISELEQRRNDYGALCKLLDTIGNQRFPSNEGLLYAPWVNMALCYLPTDDRNMSRNMLCAIYQQKYGEEFPLRFSERLC